MAAADLNRLGIHWLRSAAANAGLRPPRAPLAIRAAQIVDAVMEQIAQKSSTTDRIVAAQGDNLDVRYAPRRLATQQRQTLARRGGYSNRATRVDNSLNAVLDEVIIGWAAQSTQNLSANFK